MFLCVLKRRDVMKIIEWLSEQIEEEIADGKKYSEHALLWKQDYPKLADTLMKISEQEMQHMALLHNEVVDIIDDYRKKNGEPPSDMLAIYDYLHRKQIDKSTEVKAMQIQYRQ